MTQKYEDRAVTNVVARVYLALGLAIGGVFGRPVTWWVSAIVFVSAVVALAWSARRTVV